MKETNKQRTNETKKEGRKREREGYRKKEEK
jgi:hypothetical protein